MNTNECSMLGIKTEITQTLGSFILGGMKVPNRIPDAAVCSCPGEITDAGGFITTHLWRTKNRDGPFSLRFVEYTGDECKRDTGQVDTLKAIWNFLKVSHSFSIR